MTLENKLRERVKLLYMCTLPKEELRLAFTEGHRSIFGIKVVTGIKQHLQYSEKTYSYDILIGLQRLAQKHKLIEL